MIFQQCCVLRLWKSCDLLDRSLLMFPFALLRSFARKESFFYLYHE